MLRLDDQWIWDSWVIDDGDQRDHRPSRPVLAFTCHPHEMTAQRIAESGEYCTWSLPSAGLLGPWDIHLARPFRAEPDLFAAPLVQLRDGSWVIVGFRNLEPKGIDAFEIIDPIPVTLDDEGYLVAR